MPIQYALYRSEKAACSSGERLDVGFLDHVLRVSPPNLLLEGPNEPFPHNPYFLLERGAEQAEQGAES